jgi:hypothetical protein
MPFELKTKNISVCGVSLTVSQASNLMDMNRSVLMLDADGKWLDGAKDSREQAQRYLETLVYPSLVACTTGDVPTLEEFINDIPATDSEEWIIAARELNPRWFLLGEQDEQEKKEPLQTSSTPD